MNQGQPLLCVKNIHFAYEQEQILQGISFNINPQERVGVIGCNGAGKTTLFLLICGILPVDQGEIWLCQQPVTEQKFRPEIGYVFQNPDDQLFCPTVWDDVAFGPRNMKLLAPQVQERVQQALEMCGCHKLQKRPSHHLSGGEKRMVAIASVLALRPQLVIYDEPTSNLDMRARRVLINLLRQADHAQIIASHDLEFILEVCTRVVLIDQGKIVADGTPRQIMSNQQQMQDCGLEVPYSLFYQSVPS